MFFTSPLLATYGIKAVFSDRQGGCSIPPFDTLNLGLGLGDQEKHVAENLSRLCQQSSLPIPHQVTQVHGSQVYHAQGEGGYHDMEADILLTDLSSVALAVRTADCLPILLADPHAKVIAAVHAGWRGTVAKVVAVAIAEMQLLGAKPEHIVASMGACIADCCFEINGDIASQLHMSCGYDVSRHNQGRLVADLAQANYWQMLQSGLQAAHVERSEYCTSCSSERSFFSFRRDAGKTGRQLAMVCL